MANAAADGAELRALLTAVRRYGQAAAIASSKAEASLEAIEMAPADQAAREATVARYAAGVEDIAAQNVLRRCAMFARVSPGALPWPRLSGSLVIRQPGVSFARRGRPWAEVVEADDRLQAAAVALRAALAAASESDMRDVNELIGCATSGLTEYPGAIANGDTLTAVAELLAAALNLDEPATAKPTKKRGGRRG